MKKKIYLDRTPGSNCNYRNSCRNASARIEHYKGKGQSQFLYKQSQTARAEHGNLFHVL